MASEIEDALCAGLSSITINDGLNVETKQKLSENFIKCVSGYHLINNDPIKETPWEDINSTILEESGYIINSQSNGSHKSGSDLDCSLGKFSNKSCKIENGLLKISSYRLTTICNNSNHGSEQEIINEINKRKNFEYYSIICREETNDSITNENIIIYDWYLIPSGYLIFDPSKYTWQKKLSKKDSVVGWETNKVNGASMLVTFSMSSQLWINIPFTEIKNYIIGNCKVIKKRKLNWIKLYNLRESLID